MRRYNLSIAGPRGPSCYKRISLPCTSTASEIPPHQISGDSSVTASLNTSLEQSAFGKTPQPICRSLTCPQPLTYFLSHRNKAVLMQRLLPKWHINLTYGSLSAFGVTLIIHRATRFNSSTMASHRDACCLRANTLAVVVRLSSDLTATYIACSVLGP